VTAISQGSTHATHANDLVGSHDEWLVQLALDASTDLDPLAVANRLFREADNKLAWRDAAKLQVHPLKADHSI